MVNVTTFLSQIARAGTAWLVPYTVLLREQKYMNLPSPPLTEMAAGFK